MESTNLLILREVAALLNESDVTTTPADEPVALIAKALQKYANESDVASIILSKNLRLLFTEKSPTCSTN